MKKNLPLIVVVLGLVLSNASCGAIPLISKLTKKDTNTGYTNSTSNSAASNTTTTGATTAIPYSSGSLLGKWQEKDSPNHTLEFKDDGTLVIIYMGSTFKDKYSYSNDHQIRDTDTKGKTRITDFTVKGSEMTLIYTDAVDPSLRNQYYVRAKN